MPKGTLDSVLNVVIPSGVILGIGFWFYSLVLREPVGRLIEWWRNRGGKGGSEPSFNNGPQFGMGGDDGDYYYVPK